MTLCLYHTSDIDDQKVIQNPTIRGLPTSSPWTRATFAVNRFLPGEWPLFRPAPSRLMSLGKEQAETSVVAIGWSPQGLALHRHSALAVLTSNLVVSLWASNSDPSVSDSWQRVLVINRVDSSDRNSWHDLRAMTWAPSLCLPSFRAPFSKWKWGIPILAVADSDSKVHYLEISSPSMTGCAEWKCQKLPEPSTSAASIALESWPKEPGHEPAAFQFQRRSLLAECLQKTSFVEQITFSPWESSRSDATTEVGLYTCKYMGRQRLVLSLGETPQQVCLSRNIGLVQCDSRYSCPFNGSSCNDPKRHVCEWQIHGHSKL